MRKNQAITAVVIVASVVLSGCASPGYYGPVASQPYPVSTPYYPASPQSYPVSAPAYSNTYGVVDSIQMTQVSSANGSGIGVGTVIGSVVGGLLGNQVGGGSGKTVATVAGVLGGAVVGSQMEQRNNTQMRDTYQIGVRMDNGSYQTMMQDNISDLRVGNRVRIENGNVYRY